jgi:peptidoglycan hydrolase-like protein with peptidoglycan-binding domain
MYSVKQRPSALKSLKKAKNRQLSCLFLASAVGVLGVVDQAQANPVLKKGTSGSQVQKLQEKLQSLGYLTENPTGVFTAETEKAVIMFQQSKGLTADGVVGSKTMSVLFGNTNNLNIGASNSKLPPSNGPLPVPAPPPLGNLPGNVATNASTLQNNNNKSGTQNNLMAIRSNNSSSVNQVNPTTNLVNNKKSYLFSGQNFQRGDRHQGVALLQQELQKRGYYRGTVDGVYGSNTEQAVRAFQRAHNLSTDGMVGMQTLAYFAR